jgi:hypothetical protein
VHPGGASRSSRSTHAVRKKPRTMPRVPPASSAPFR